ncbi:DUF192 domain-containing protein [Solemya velesiana gill symbiont]|uniref:DUF192 domain-containing protein n=1 Tax=Solemya velesiana gill symbiont TaxID=1918948 RepID=A0A1T2KU29_9GAMM|nr:DUF192 domain-containing protein [Solemya velesiana gill symbiont]OOZ36322.1 hypothetical protein BOW51_07645 [Solemya velesiana gill symbiont]
MNFLCYIKTKALLGVVLWSVLLSTGCDARELVTVEVGGIPVSVEVASDPDARRIGLMSRRHLDADKGMLFVFPRQEIKAIWMRDTLIPLDVGFFDMKGMLVNYLSMEPRTETLHFSVAPAIYALEMNQGWYEANGIEPGMRLELPYAIQGR